MVKFGICLAIAALGLVAGPGLTQPLELTVPLPLAPGIAAFPKLTGTDHASLSINADLARRDAKALGQIEDCLSLSGSDWARFIDVPFAGPRFVSYLGADDFFCTGAAHPNQHVFALTFDLQTGSLVDWSALLPAPYVVRRYPELRSDNAVMGSDVLSRLYLAHYPRPTEDDCTKVVRRTDLDFLFWLDGNEGALMMVPDNLAHAVKACADTAAIPAAELQGLGAAPALIKALSIP